MKVLVVRLGAFGDIIHTLPLAADLVEAGHQVEWLCEDRWLPVLAGSEALSAVHAFPRWALRDKSKTLAQGLLALRGLIRCLRAQRFDAVIDAQGLVKSALVAALCGAPLRIGHARSRARELSWLVSKGKGPAFAEHVIDQQRALALPLTRSRPDAGWRFPLPKWSSEKEWAREWLERRGLNLPWVLNVGAGWPTKVWPKQRQIEFIKLLKRNQQAVVLTWGSNAEYDRADEVIAEAEHGVLAPPTSIPQLAGLLAHSDLVISGDTGPLHLALALGTPAIGLFGPVRASRNGPRGRWYRTIQAPGALWERKDISRVDMASIEAETVWKLGQEIMVDRHAAAALAQRA
jgi:lipopolysaccharide heptosyltransferase I